FDMVDDDAFGIYARIAFEHIDDQPRALELILEVGRMNQDHLVVAHGEIDMALENGQFVAGILVQANLPNAKDCRTIQKLRDEIDDFIGESHVLGLLWIDAEPAIMEQAIFRGALRLEIRQLPEIIVEALRTAAIESGPESRFANRRAP